MPTQSDAEIGAPVPPVTPAVTFLGESAGFQNTFGMYKIAADGTIFDVQILFANTSATDSGGGLEAGVSRVELDVNAGDELGFFVLPDAYALNDASLFEADRYEFRDWGGGTANIYDDTGPRLYAINEETGESTLVESLWNASSWHMAQSAEAGVLMNVDGADHARGHSQYDGSVTVGFSDVYGGGDGTFDSLLVNINLGTSGASIVDDGIAYGTDQTEQTWIAPVDIGADLPDVPLAVLPRTERPDLSDEEALGEDGGETPATVTFMGEGAWYQSTFGMYKIDDAGMIYDVEILFANASNSGSGGDLIAGESTVEIDAEVGDNLGFFILSDGWRMNNDKSVFEADDYVFRDWGGGEGNIHWSTGLRLFAVDDETGQESLVNARFNAASWHMHHRPEDGIDMNVDNFDHMRGQLKYDGSITVGFEDIRGGGDRDFNDVMFNINLGDSGAVIEDKAIFDGTDQREGGFYTDDRAAAKAKVTFLSETADYKNTLGMYKIAEDGTIEDVQIIFANASKYDSGGELIAGESSVEIDVDASDNLGFFILPDGYKRNSDKSLFEGTSYVLRNEGGDIGNVNSDQGLTLYHVDQETGAETLLHARYDNATYHMSHDNAQGISLNSDGKDHGLGELLDGNKVVLGFEDIQNNGDWDFDDVVVQVELSSTGATVADPNLKTEGEADQSQVGWLFEANDDVFDIQPWRGENDRLNAGEGAELIDAQAGDDLVYGDGSDNMLLGSQGNDVLLGHDGDDTLDGGSGLDHLNGGNGADMLVGAGGKDLLWGQLGTDTLDGGLGDDKLWGGAGADALLGGEGDDRLYGGAGADRLNGNGGSNSLFGGADSDVFVFDATGQSGGFQVINDLDLTGTDRDTIDVSALGLLAAGQTAAHWLEQNTAQEGDDLTLNLNGTALVIANFDAALQDLESAMIF
ncbi:DUF4114 domain-containing protein [Pelagimonas varians]|uniref:RTX-I toxin determinant A from serotypes 1/9 n=1 Tax=Pelagimonas varians TaxID=696760 RepID=A0A238KV55_9RHOB|nr:DUF4114 domain-containing protein [Pelagimonas varians]PYG32553.1 hemolysin type calcium-binding protein [Pelagimonas varians]SMX45916.1 RTX-I toxin determinant A from serotypes 1/9 [Pelagimonas varians]